MNKSFSESGGTVLSTNWSDIGKEKVKDIEFSHLIEVPLKYFPLPRPQENR